jgi:starch synthase
MAGALSVLKGGVLAADALTVAAPNLVTDLADESRHGPLAVAFARRATATTGILAGLDYAVYNPATDAELASRFDAEHLDAKRICRTAVLRDAGLDLDGDRPLLVCMSQAGAGFDAAWLKTLCGELLNNDLNLIVAGDGAQQLDPLPQSAARKAALISKSTPAMERKLYAAADLVLCLTPYPGDGLSIRKAQRYAAIPIAQSQGAALDTIVDCDPQLETGTGFLFEGPADVEATVQRALVAYRSGAWPRLQRRVARLDLSWDRVAHRYQKLYRQLQKQ